MEMDIEKKLCYFNVKESGRPGLFIPEMSPKEVGVEESPLLCSIANFEMSEKFKGMKGRVREATKSDTLMSKWALYKCEYQKRRNEWSSDRLRYPTTYF